MTEGTVVDIDMMTLDDIADLPAFGNWPSGAYHVRLDDGIESKNVNDKPVRSCNVVLVAALEISGQLDAGEAEPKPGDTEGFMWQMDNEMGRGFYKQFLAPIGEKLGTKSIAEIQSGCKGLELMIVQKRTFNAVKDRHFVQLKKVAVL